MPNRGGACPSHSGAAVQLVAFATRHKSHTIKDDVQTMKKTIKPMLVVMLLVATMLMVTACVDNSTPYDRNNAAGYTVSIRFDANGGLFTTNTAVITDSYNISKLSPNANGKVELALLSPDDQQRGSGNYFTPAKNGYFLAGWYTQRTETGKDAQGDPIYTYANRWDFEENTFELDPGKEYSAAEPVLTLYAAWVPMFQINFYDLNDGSLIGNYTYDPTAVQEIRVPQWGEDGAMEMYKFPVKNGYTFEKAFYDKAATQEAVDTVTHTGYVDAATGTAKDPVMDLYMDLMEGEWYHIYSVEQFKKHASVNGCYILHTDLDFKCNSENKDERESWPTNLMYGNFNGTIVGNGHCISNVKLEQTDNSRTNAGLFGVLGAGAKLENVTFENVTFIIRAGTRTAGTTFGLLAGTISPDAQLENVQILNSVLQLNADKAYFGTEDFAIGRFCGVGLRNGMDFSGIGFELLGENDKWEIIQDEKDNEIVIKFG